MQKTISLISGKFKQKYVDIAPATKATFQNLWRAAVQTLNQALCIQIRNKKLQGQQING